jgi:hypothetical protein
MRRIRIGAGAGFSGDRIEPAVELAQFGNLDYLVFECLAERTIALAQARRIENPLAGFDPMLEDRMRAVLPICARNRVKIITSMGAANPEAAASFVAQLANEMGLLGLKIAAVTGDDVLDLIRNGAFNLMEQAGTTRDLGETIVSANAYMGAEGIVEALSSGADVVITGRVCDPSLFVAPMIHEFQWAPDDWTMIAKGIVVGHLLECAGQITGGYFADPGKKDVPNLARLGFPLAEIAADGSALITKVDGSGGYVNVATCKEQLLYEILDPTAYLQADAICDISHVSFTDTGPDRVTIEGVLGRAAPKQLKVTIGYRDGYVGEGQMSYAGPGALARARLALDIVRERIRIVGIKTTEQRFDIIGDVSANLSLEPEATCEPREARIRVVGRTTSLREAERIGAEVETLYTNGPSGGGGATRSTRQVIAAVSTLVPRATIVARVHYRVA